MRQPTKLRLAVIVGCVVALASTFSITITQFAWGVGDLTLAYLLLYPLLLTGTILIIANVRLGSLIALFIAIGYCLLLSSAVGEYFLFKSGNSILLLVILLPFFVFVSLIPMTVLHLTEHKKNGNPFFKISIVIAMLFPLFSVGERFNKDYSDTIYAQVDFENTNKMTITCRPSFADARAFYITSNSKELAALVKSKGELYQGSYFVADLRVLKRFRFQKFQFFKIESVNEAEVHENLIWNPEELTGDSSFLQP